MAIERIKPSQVGSNFRKIAVGSFTVGSSTTDIVLSIGFRAMAAEFMRRASSSSVGLAALGFWTDDTINSRAAMTRSNSGRNVYIRNSVSSIAPNGSNEIVGDVTSVTDTTMTITITTNPSGSRNFIYRIWGR